MKVWVVFFAYPYEGYEMAGAFKTEGKAQSYIDWRRREDLSRHFNKESLEAWSTEELREWHSDVCDKYYTYEEVEVQ